MSSLVPLFIDHLLVCNELTMSQLQKFVTNASGFVCCIRPLIDTAGRPCLQTLVMSPTIYIKCPLALHGLALHGLGLQRQVFQIEPMSSLFLLNVYGLPAFAYFNAGKIG